MTRETKNSLIKTISGSIRGVDSSRQLALGIAMGMLIGFVPKENLIFVGLLVFLILSGANLVTGILSAIVSSLAALGLTNLFDFAGEQILGTEFVTSLLANAMQWPLVAWTDINNTVVCGSLFVGLGFFVPIYFVSFGVFHHLRLRIKRMLEDRLIQTRQNYAT